MYDMKVHGSIQEYSHLKCINAHHHATSLYKHRHVSNKQSRRDIHHTQRRRQDKSKQENLYGYLFSHSPSPPRTKEIRKRDKGKQNKAMQAGMTLCNTEVC